VKSKNKKRRKGRWNTREVLEYRNELDCKDSKKMIYKEKSLECVEILIIKERNSDVIIMKRQKTCACKHILTSQYPMSNVMQE
jgi:hypothetical protein